MRSASLGANSRVVAAALATGLGAHPAGRYPAGGFFNRKAPIIVMTMKTTPRIMNVVRQPYVGISQFPASGPKMAEPPPYPATARPTAKPRRSGNHLAITGMGVA